MRNILDDGRQICLHRNLHTPDLCIQAYKDIAKPQGGMTPGADGMTFDDMTSARIDRIIFSFRLDIPTIHQQTTKSHYFQIIST